MVVLLYLFGIIGISKGVVFMYRNFILLCCMLNVGSDEMFLFDDVFLFLFLMFYVYGFGICMVVFLVCGIMLVVMF